MLVVGNVVEDRAPDGRWTPGGPALYSALAASRLGAEVTLMTHLSPGYDRSLFAGLTLRARPTTQVPRYQNSYDATGARSQLFEDGSGPLDAGEFQDVPYEATILAPAFHELKGFEVAPAGVVAVALQGVLRSADAAGRIQPHPDAESQARPFRGANYAFLSAEDTEDADTFACKYSTNGPATFVTAGRDGARLYRHGQLATTAPAHPAHEVDPTGAGDCFLAAFVVRLLETADERAAIAFATAAAAMAVEGQGFSAIPSRAQVETRLREVAA